MNLGHSASISPAHRDKGHDPQPLGPALIPMAGYSLRFGRSSSEFDRNTIQDQSEVAGLFQTVGDTESPCGTTSLVRLSQPACWSRRDSLLSGAHLDARKRPTVPRAYASKVEPKMTSAEIPAAAFFVLQLKVKPRLILLVSPCVQLFITRLS